MAFMDKSGLTALIRLGESGTTETPKQNGGCTDLVNYPKNITFISVKGGEYKEQPHPVHSTL